MPLKLKFLTLVSSHYGVSCRELWLSGLSVVLPQNICSQKAMTPFSKSCGGRDNTDVYKIAVSV